MRQSLLAIAVVLLGIALVGCGGRAGLPPAAKGPSQPVGADSPEAVADRILTAVRDGDKAALEACFMPGAPSASRAHLETILAKRSLTGVTWRLLAGKRCGRRI